MMTENNIGLLEFQILPWWQKHRFLIGELSIATNVTADESLFSESELTETIHTDIEKWIDGSRLSVINITTEKIKDRSESLNAVNSFDSETERSGEIQYGNFVSKIKSTSVGDDLDNFPKSDNSSNQSLSISTDDKFIESDDIQVRRVYIWIPSKQN